MQSSDCKRGKSWYIVISLIAEAVKPLNYSNGENGSLKIVLT